MPFQKKTPVILGSVPNITPSGAEVVAQRTALAASAADVATNSIGAFLVLPAGCVPVGVHIDADAALTAEVGIVNDAETAVSTSAADGGAAWVPALAANGESHAFSKAMARVQPSQVDRKVGVRITAAGTAGVVGMTLSYRGA